MIAPPLNMDFSTGALRGFSVLESARRLADLIEIFNDKSAASRMPTDTVVYTVQSFLPVREGTPGGLYWGTTVIYPGQVGDEYFMTKGHFHSLPDRGEYYITASGEGALILMDSERRTRFETMSRSGIHYIPGYTAHRVANIGTAPLRFFACWPSDAGHDYETIQREGFSARLRCVNGHPTLIPEAL